MVAAKPDDPPAGRPPAASRTGRSRPGRSAPAPSTCSSSGSRVFSGRPGGCSGNARQSTPTAPVARAVRHATRAPDERPPTYSGSPFGRCAQLLDDGGPGHVELRRGRGRLAAGDAVGLLDQRNGDADRVGRLRRRLQVRRADPAAGAVPEHQQAATGVCRPRAGGPARGRAVYRARASSGADLTASAPRLAPATLGNRFWRSDELVAAPPSYPHDLRARGARRGRALSPGGTPRRSRAVPTWRRSRRRRPPASPGAS